MTSNGVVEEARRILGTNLGHAGTLDPAATGVLVLGVGPARRFISLLRDDKEYEAVMKLGVESDTLDMEGRITAERPVTSTAGEVREAAAGLVGEVALPVPAFSAVHVGGRRLYEMARSGVAVVPPVRISRVSSLEVLETGLPLVRFRLACSGGTYVRSIAAEWGRRLGCGALIVSLVRTRSGDFLLRDSLSLEKLREMAAAGRMTEALIPSCRALAHVPEALLDEERAGRARMGQEVPTPAGSSFAAGTPVRLVREGGGMIGMAEASGDGSILKPRRMLPDGEEVA
jgi:tRNA pseudouridine55 synthase